jgi:multiple sugar transport system substrate-binding protein
MLDGEIVQLREGHPTKGTHWFPTYNTSEGTRALNFIRSQIGAGVKPQKDHFWGKEFLDRKFAVMIEALQHHVPFLSASQQSAFEDKVGMLPMFPIPDLNHSSSTLLGGWQLGIPNSSRNKDLAWELIIIMMEPNIITPMLKKYGYLPTRVSVGEGVNSPSGDFTIPYYKEIVSMIEIGNTRPHIPEFP